SPAVLTHYADFQKAADDKVGARASLRKAVALAQHAPAPMAALVAFEEDVDGPEAALAAAQSFAKDEPQFSKILAADVLAKSGRRDQAVAILTEEQKAHPSSMVAAKLGEILYSAGKHDEAVRLLQSWIKDHDDAG